ncbi:leucine-rich repeat domain-containing protein [Rhodoferax ferrireducens]|uniref:leucine-rich repeat domain-containing protein n=1 Tax=Rhodoferax ferrireducens TaxID=192843 RepID=UPI000E0E0302|nr:leucine-rich repeat domain-containing protein [Rhodoferax ferrireducens]
MTPEQQQAYDTALERIETYRVPQSAYLDLKGLGLTRLPPQIVELTTLKMLDLSENQLSNLPPQIGQLTALTHLYPPCPLIIPADSFMLGKVVKILKVLDPTAQGRKWAA